MNPTSNYDFTIVVPVYNEEENMDRLKEILSSYVQFSSVKSCVLFVNDGSTDNSKELMAEICQKYRNFFFISFARNAGLSAAIKAGFDLAQSPFVGYIDADLQTTPADFELLLPHRNEYEMVMGIRIGRKDSLGKKLSSKIANGFRRMMNHDGIEDTGCPLKVLNTQYAKRIPCSQACTVSCLPSYNCKTVK